MIRIYTKFGTALGVITCNNFPVIGWGVSILYGGCDKFSPFHWKNQLPYTGLALRRSPWWKEPRGSTEPSEPTAGSLHAHCKLPVHFGSTTGSPLVIGVEDTEDSKPKDGRRW